MRQSVVILPFALVGAVGGGLFAHVLSDKTALVSILVLSTALSAASLGFIVEKARSPKTAMGVTLLGGPVAGALNGVLALATSMVVRPSEYRWERTSSHVLEAMFGSAVVGALVSLLFVVPLALVTNAASGVHARRGSITWASQRRRVLRVAATICVLVAGIVPAHRFGFPAICIVAMALVLLAVAMLEAKVARSLAALPQSGTVDLGVGTERWSSSSRTDTYRRDAPAVVVWGDPAATRAIVSESVRMAQLGAAIGIGCLAIRFLFGGI